MCFKTPALSREAKAHLFGTSYIPGPRGGRKTKKAACSAAAAADAAPAACLPAVSTSSQMLL